MRRARLAAVLGVAVALTWWLAPTPAYADGLAVAIDSPGENVNSNSFTVRGHVSPAAEVRNVHFELLRSGARVDSGSTTEASFVFPVSVSTNGVYTVRIAADGVGLAGLVVVDGYADRDVTVAARPAAPTNLNATVLPDRRVSLSWTGVSHDDLRGYAIYRKLGSGAFTLVGGALAGTTTFTEPTPTAGGPVQFYVTSLRNGPVASDVATEWLESAPSATAPATVPAPPAPAEPTGDTTTTVPPGTPQPDDISSPGLTDIFAASPATIPPPQISPTPTLPDGGFSPSLPFSATTEPAKVGGRSPGRPAAASASGDLSAGNDAGSSTNRRALLVPVATGSVLCVAALHLRWLNRRLGAFPVGGSGGGLGADLEPTDFDPASLPDVPDADRLPVGAGR